MSTLTLGHPRTASGRVERWLAVGALVLAQVVVLAFGLAPVPARADFVPLVLAQARLTLAGSTYLGDLEMDTYSYDWDAYQPGVNGMASVSDVYNPGSPTGFCTSDLPYGCPSGSVRADVDQVAGTFKVHARNLADVSVPDQIGGDRALVNIGHANAVIDDAITLSAPATLTLRGHLAGFVETSFAYEPSVSFSAGARFWREDTSNPEGGRIDYGGYGKYLSSRGTIDEDFSVQVSLPAGTTYFSAGMKASTDVSSGAYRRSETEFESYSEYADVVFDNTFGFEIVVPAGVVATSASGLLPVTQVPELPAFVLLGVGLAGLGFLRRKH